MATTDPVQEILNTTTEVCGSKFNEGGITRGEIDVVALVVVIVFYLIILAVGVIASRVITGQWRSKSSEDQMVAGRNIGLLVGIFTMTATWVGGGYINGTAENVFTSGYGLAWTQATWGYSLSLILGGLFFAKNFRNANYVTLLDPFERKYGRLMSVLLYIPAFLGDVFWLAAILSALGATLSVIIGLNHTWAVITSAIVAVLYTLIGGLYSVAYTDIIQLMCIFVGLWLALPFAWTNDAVSSISDTAWGENGWLGTIEKDERIGSYIDSGLLLIFGGIPWQAYFQRVLSQRTARNAQILSIAAGFGCMFLAVPCILIGAVAKSTDWNATEYRDFGCIPVRKEDYKLALPMVLRFLTPRAVSIIGLGAVAAAVMSSSDSAVLSAGSQFARNVYTPIASAIRLKMNAGKLSDTEILWVMRIAIIIVAATGTVMAILINSIYAMFVLCGDFVYVILFPQLLLVVYFKKGNTYGSLIGYIIGMFFRLTGGESLLGFPALIKYPYYDEESHKQNFPFKTFCMLLSLVTTVVVSYLAAFLYHRFESLQKYDAFECFTVRYELKEDKVGGKEPEVSDQDIPRLDTKF